jgi:hypothetical protein
LTNGSVPNGGFLNLASSPYYQVIRSLFWASILEFEF